jgi:hypothetical protein
MSKRPREHVARKMLKVIKMIMVLRVITLGGLTLLMITLGIWPRAESGSLVMPGPQLPCRCIPTPRFRILSGRLAPRPAAPIDLRATVER